MLPDTYIRTNALSILGSYGSLNPSVYRYRRSNPLGKRPIRATGKPLVPRLRWDRAALISVENLANRS